MSFDSARVQAALPGRRIAYYETLDSTMTTAAAVREPGAIVIANEQSAGQGRHGHTWHSEPDSGLYFTIVLAPKLAMEQLPVVTLALGLAVQEAIGQVCNLAVDLRWPNDLLIGPRKCAGILTQLDGDRVLAGIGINVNHSSLPADLAAIATSLRLAAGRPHSREELLCAVAGGVDRMVSLLEHEGSSPVLALFTEQSSYARGRRVRVDLPGNSITGTTAGLTADGYLLLDGDDGRRHTILAGGVRPEN
jgi:BirA family biotin operon repressor/biotin-[acetyl-CoA-carboxylase] ligase